VFFLTHQFLKLCHVVKAALCVCGFHPECSLGVDVQADVVLLVDGSYSIGVTNFAKVRAFLEVLVNTFDIGPNKVQIALVQYSRDPYTEFYLNTHQDVNAVVKAVRTFPYRGGSTNTGRAMTYVREKIFQTSRGARANVPRVTILITDGKSSDAFKDPATKLRNTDVEIFAVGVKDAVRSELEAIANAPAETHVYTVEDFDAFQRISKELTQSICLRIEQEIRSIFQRRNDVSASSFRATWTAAPGNVQAYKVRWKSLFSGEQGDKTVPGDQTSTVLDGLSPETRYQVSVIAAYDQKDSEPLTGLETTDVPAFKAPRNLLTSEPTKTSFRVSWDPAPGDVRGYRVTFHPSGNDVDLGELMVPGTVSSTVLKQLQPDTEYSVTVVPVYPEMEGKSMSETGKTSGVKNLKVVDPSISTLTVRWDPAVGNVRTYKVFYAAQPGGQQETQVSGLTTSTVLTELSPDTEYRVTVVPVYEDVEGNRMSENGKTSEFLPNRTGPWFCRPPGVLTALCGPFAEVLGGVKNLQVTDPTTSSLRVRWEAAEGNVRQYRIFYVPAAGGAEDMVGGRAGPVLD
uniref:Collagen, type XII, alpha 1b n=1 Tax=Poecilia latipinna TaxID=48699 RepID=A0A3B3VC18_9TELE